MRWLAIGTACLALMACSKRDDANGPSEALTNTQGIAFSYDYSFRMPAARIRNAQDGHASACERLGTPRCRITGMTYRIDDGGDVSAGLSLALAAPLARRFANEGVTAIEQARGALTNAQIIGDDAGAQEDGDAGRLARGDAASIDRQLARGDLSPAERAELRRQRAAAVAQSREAEQVQAATRQSIATTPVSFSYRTGRGVGPAARLGDAWATAVASSATTLSILLTMLAMFGPPAAVLIALFLLWRRWGRHGWARLVRATAGRDTQETREA